MTKPKKTQKHLNFFGMKIDYKEYTKNFLPEATYQLEKLYNKLGIKTKIKTTIKDKTEYWDFNKNYPTTLDDFINKYFKKRKPEGLEGIWEQNYMGNPIYYGFIKDKEKFHAYFIDSSAAVIKQTSGSFFKDIFNAPEADYGILSGTKFGIFSYDTKRNTKGLNAKEMRELQANNPDITECKFLKFKGVGTVIDTFSNETYSYPINLEMEYDVIQVGETELRGEGKDQIMLEEKYGQSRRSYKIWPNDLPEAKEVPKDHPGYKKYGENDKKKDEESKTGTSAGTGFFISNKGHIVTNYHVIQNRKNIKFLFNNDEVSAKLVSFDQQLDLALLKSKIKNKSFIKFSNQSPKKAQNILVAGYPHAKAVSDDLIITGGIVNSLKGIGNNTSMLQIDANINKGNSGGPIVDKSTGNLVAVATMMLVGKDAGTDKMNFGIKSSQVKDFLEANNVDVTVKNNKFNIAELEESTVFIYCN